MSSSNVAPKLEIVESAEVETVTKDKTIVADRVFQKLVTEVSNVELKQGGKWVALVEYCISKNYSRGTKADIKRGREIILKSLLDLGKTESSALSIRSDILKLSREDMAETFAQLKAGEITVREARQAGRKEQSSPSLSNQDKFERALNEVIRFAVVLGYSPSKVGDAAESAFNEYLAKKEIENAAKEAAKAAKKS
jgi:hypothetical protein